MGKLNRAVTPSDAVLNADMEMRASDGWGHESPATRARILGLIRDRMAEERNLLASVEASETGKFLCNALDDVDGCIDLWSYAIDLALADSQLGSGFAQLNSQLSGITSHRPLGPVLMITPYNYPLIVLSERLPFALAAGCSVVVKPSEITPSSTQIVSQIARDCGLPERVLQVVLGDGTTGSELASNPLFGLVSFTGSTKTAAAVSKLIDHRSVRTSFELGGKNAFIVFEDADVKAAAESAAFATTVNGGQACIAPSRIIVHRRISEEFLEMLCRAYVNLILDNLAEFGVPIQQPPTRRYLERARDHLRKIESVGWTEYDAWSTKLPMEAIDGFVRPRLFIVERFTEPLFNEEFFVPYVTVSTFTEPDEAIAIANCGEMGLAGYFWTASRSQFLYLHERVRAGRQWWNTDMRSFSPKLPIGGLALSGIGRELGPSALDYYRLPVAATLISER